MDDSQSNEDADFLDEYFAIDESIGTYEELDDLFDGPERQQASAAPNLSTGKQSDQPDNTYQLFKVDLDEEGTADEFQDQTLTGTSDNQWGSEAFGTKSTDLSSDTVPDDQGLTDELTALMHGCNESDPTDNATNLETDAPQNDDYGVIELEQSGPFILDDGDGLWAEELADGTDQDAEGDDLPNIDLILDSHEEELMRNHKTPSTQEPSDLIPEINATLDDLFYLEDEALTLEKAAEEFAAETNVATPNHEDAPEDPLSFLENDSPEQPNEVDEDLSGAMSLMPSSPSTDEVSNDEAGWEPLPAKSIDQLSEIEGIERTDSETTYEAANPHLQSFEDHTDDEYENRDYEHAEYDDSAYEDEELDDEEFVDDHEVYATEGEDEESAIGDAPDNRRMSPRMLITIAASLAIAMGTIATAVAPSLVGLDSTTREVAQTDLPRPTVQVSVTEPPPVPLQTPNSNEVNPPAIAGQGDPSVLDNQLVGSNSQSQSSDVADAAPAQQLPSNRNIKTSEPTDTTTSNALTIPADEVAAVTMGSAAASAAPIQQSSDAHSAVANTAIDGQNAEESGERTPISSPTNTTTTLARFGETLLVGGLADPTRSTQAVDGVMPGSRALAQLHNGNYFVGQLKRVADKAITLRVATGELTIEKTEIAKITPLGADEYEQLQEASKGFVRLNNNNRLIGGILSRIADDHVVLEFRKNRVMLPKSEIGEIVSGDRKGDDVRLGTTDEEDRWVRNLAKRQLGTGKVQTQHSN